MAVIGSSTNRSSKDGRSGTMAIQRPLITAARCTPEIVAAYDSLLTNLDVAMMSRAGGMVAVAGIDETADAALVAANLALTAARSNDRTLLVDCDLASGSLGHLFAMETTPGLAQLLNGEHTDLRSLAQPSDLPTLGIIAAGATGERHSRLARLGDLPATLLRLKNAADRVILLAPPALQGVDLLRLAPYVDGILLVLTVGHTSREATARARTLLERVEAPLVGAVLAPR